MIVATDDCQSRAATRRNPSWAHHHVAGSCTLRGRGPKSAGWSTRIGRNRLSAGSALPVAQCRPAPRSLTQLEAVIDEVSNPPACMLGPTMEPLISDHAGPAPVPL